LREVGDAFSYAKMHASELGAGTLVFVGRFDLAEFAVVLEPEEPLRTARRAFYAGMAAMADALVAHAPPETPIAFHWPDAIYINRGLVGGGQFAWPDGPEDQPPEWLVFGAMIRTVSMAEGEAGLRPLSAALEEEGFDDPGSDRLVESFARHLMVQVDAWQEFGFSEVAKSYLARLEPEQGGRRELDEAGDLLVRRPGKVEIERRRLGPALAAASWLDPATRGPR
jgi:biotin-(acetyl-CoA carboxylase) ligase